MFCSSIRPSLWLGLLLFQACALPSVAASPCAACHPREVALYSHSAMSHSLRRAGREPEGAFEHAFSGTKFTIYSDQAGLWQRMERGGDVSQYRVEYVVGSGKHASGYLVRIGDHLFQSPICFYTRLGRYDMAPGSEATRDPDYIRPVTEECVLCHSGKPLPIEGTLNEYEAPAFAQESISCERCHGDPSRHLKAPLPGSIVNPAKLPVAARNSVCEQCHLKGAVRVLNPGKKFEDFHPGEALESVFTIYTAAVPADTPRETIKVISQAEELALSLCARKSNGRLWCGTCHDPHSSASQPDDYYRARCLTCHERTLASGRSLGRAHSPGSGSPHPDGITGNCVGCHMEKQNARDGGHTVFTDHRISRRPAAHPEQTEGNGPADGSELVAWRPPAPELRERNLALAYTEAGTETDSASDILRGYQMLAGLEERFSSDPAVVNALGQSLVRIRRPLDAADYFERVLKLGPDSAVTESAAGTAWMQAGHTEKAVGHLERAIQLDPLLLPAAEALMQAYRRQGDSDKLAALGERVREAMGASAPQEAGQ